MQLEPASLYFPILCTPAWTIKRIPAASPSWTAAKKAELDPAAAKDELTRQKAALDLDLAKRKANRAYAALDWAMPFPETGQ